MGEGRRTGKREGEHERGKESRKAEDMGSVWLVGQL